MKKELNPAVVGIVIAILALVVGFFFWKGSQPAKNPPGGMFGGGASDNIPAGK